MIKTAASRVFRFASEDRFLIGASIFRIAMGGLILFQYTIIYQQRHYLFGPDAVWPFESFLKQLAETGSFSLYALNRSSLFFELIYHLGIGVTLVWLLGWRTRLMTPLVFLFLWSLRERNSFLSDGGDNISTIVLFYAIFANLGAHFSVDSSRVAVTATDTRTTWQKCLTVIHNATILAIAIQVSVVYVVSGLYKVQGEMWQNGTALYYIMRVDEFTWPGYSEYVYQNVYLINLLTYLTVAFQVAFPLLLFLNRYTRLFALGWAICFHLGIGMFMGLLTFAGYMLAAEVTLLSDAEYRRLGAYPQRLYRAIQDGLLSRLRAIGRRTLAPKLEMNVFYDGWCPFCTKTMATINQMDWFGLIRPLSFREPAIAAAFEIDVKRAERRLLASSQRNRALVEGSFAFEHLCARVVPLWPLAGVIWVANKLGVGQTAYDWFAARRIVIHPPCDEACALPVRQAVSAAVPLSPMS